MLRLLIPIVLLVLGTGGGVFAARMLAEPATEDTGEMSEMPPETDANPPEPATEDETSTEHEYARLNNQFVVPIVTEDGVEALVVLALSLEVEAGSIQSVFSREPKLRDSFLSALFDHANLGGFDGVYTSGPKIEALRAALLTEAKAIMGDIVHDVLILDLVRQDN